MGSFDVAVNTGSSPIKMNPPAPNGKVSHIGLNRKMKASSGTPGRAHTHHHAIRDFALARTPTSDDQSIHVSAVQTSWSRKAD
jgi:hypothetical protein